jgi:phosphoribosyl-AMP cyclohydrolase
LKKKNLNVENLKFNAVNGLIPVVVQDSKTLKVLTLAYANKEAIEKTLQIGYAHFFRRTFGKVMKKGVTSGNFQKISEILVDCDQDSIVYLVDCKGPACHTGEETCFNYKLKNK